MRMCKDARLRLTLAICASLMIGPTGCGRSPGNDTTAGFDPHEGERRKEMRSYMETNKQQAAKPRAQRNHP
jgi:hypothetical protein